MAYSLLYLGNVAVADKKNRTRHVPAATPFSEGVYAITSTGKESHLAYQITFPKIGEVQNELGVHEKARYIVSVKNPEFPGPDNSSFGRQPSYSESTQEMFKGRRWIPLVPELLDYDNTQLLIIGETLGSIEMPVEGVGEHPKDDKEASLEGDAETLQREVSFSFT